MSDFTIDIAIQVPDLAYGDNEHVLRAQLWEHFQTLAALGHDDKIAEDQALKREQHRYENQEHCKDPNFHCNYEIVDICFGRQEISETNVLMTLHPYYKDVLTYEQKLKVSVTEQEKETSTEYLKKYNDIFDEQLAAAKAKLAGAKADNSPEKSQILPAQPMVPGDLELKSIGTEDVKEAPAEATNNSQASNLNLRSSFSLGKIRPPNLSKSESDQSIRFAYVTFKNIEHAEYAMRALNMRAGNRCCLRWCGCICPQAAQKMKDRMFYNEWLDCEVAGEPDEIIWENLSVSDASKPFRFCFIYCIFIILLIVSLVSMVKIQAY